MNKQADWDKREEIEWLQYSVQPPRGLVVGEYYRAQREFGGTPWTKGHTGTLEVVTSGGNILFAEFNETAMETYYNHYFGGRDKRRSDYGIWQASKERQARAGVVLVDGMQHVEGQIMARQSLDGDFDLLTGASGSMRGLLPLAKELAGVIDTPSDTTYCGIAQSYGYGLTGWLRVLLREGKIVSCKYDEIFADHQAEIAYPELKRYYRQSKYHSPCYEDPFPPGYDRHAWSVSFHGMADLLEASVVRTQKLLQLEGLPYTEGNNPGPLWDRTEPYDLSGATNSEKLRHPMWDNYLGIAETLQPTLLKNGWRGEK